MVPSELRERLIPIYYFIHNCDVILQSVFVKFIQKVICFWFIASIKINHQENHARFFSVKVILHSVFFYESATKLCYLGPPASCDPLTRLPRLLGQILLSVHIGNFSPAGWNELQETKPIWWNIKLYCS